MKRIALGLLLLLTACVNTKDPVLREQAGCVRGHYDMVMIPVFHSCGRNCSFTTMTVVPVWKCDEPIWFYRPNPNYKREVA